MSLVAYWVSLPVVGLSPGQCQVPVVASRMPQPSYRTGLRKGSKEGRKIGKLYEDEVHLTLQKLDEYSFIGLLRGGVPRGGGSLIFPKVPQSSLGILFFWGGEGRIPQVPSMIFFFQGVFCWCFFFVFPQPFERYVSSNLNDFP